MNTKPVEPGCSASSGVNFRRGLTAIDAGILGRLGRRLDDWSLTAADERDARIMRDLAEKSAEAKYAKWCAFVGVEYSSDGRAKR
jgi:hypothetical protein